MTPKPYDRADWNLYAIGKTIRARQLLAPLLLPLAPERGGKGAAGDYLVEYPGDPSPLYQIVKQVEFEAVYRVVHQE